MTGIVRGFEIKQNRNGSQKVCMLQVEISGPDDIQSVEYRPGAGQFFIPPNGSIVDVLENGSAWKIATSANDGRDFPTDLKQGEKVFYNQENNATIRINNNKTIRLENSNGFVELKENGQANLNGNFTVDP